MAEEKKLAFDAKKMLTENGAKGTKIRYTDRMQVEILVDTEYYRKGQIISPHKVKGQALIDQKIAKEYSHKKG